MTKQSLFIFILFVAVCGGFVKADEPPPSYLLFHDEAQARLDSLESNPSDTNLLERVILLNNLALYRDVEARKQAEELLKRNFKKDTTALVLMYRNLLHLLKIRDRGKTGNVSKMIMGFFGFSDNPYEEARKAYANVRLAIQKDSSSVQLRILGLGAAVESAEHLNELLDYTFSDLRWLQARTEQLDSAETFFYGLSWAKYAYKYAIIKGPKTEAIEGFDWLIFAERFAIMDGYCDEIYNWWIKIDSLQTSE